MGAEIASMKDGILTVKVSGALTQPELAAVQSQAAACMETHGAVRLLVLAEGFEGWKRDSAWGDVSFQWKYDPLIQKMAIVCEEKWKDLALMFTGQGVRRFPIECFKPGGEADALKWLVEDGEQG